MTTSNIYRTQLVYRNTNDVHNIINDKATLAEAKESFNNANAGMEVGVQLINFETGEVIESKS